MDIQPTPVRLGPAVRRTKRVSARWLSERKSTENEILQIHYDHVYYPADVFHLSVEWLLCSNLIVWRFVEVITRIANDNGFQFLLVPHSQLFPQPSLNIRLAGVADPDLIYKRSPFFSRVRFRIPRRVSYHRLLEQLTAPPLFLKLCFHSASTGGMGYDMSSADLGALGTSTQGDKLFDERRLLRDYRNPDMPGWILMEPTCALFFVTIAEQHVAWTESRYYGKKPTKPLKDGLSSAYERRMEEAFADFKSCLHRAMAEAEEGRLGFELMEESGAWAF